MHFWILAGITESVSCAENFLLSLMRRRENWRSYPDGVSNEYERLSKKLLMLVTALIGRYIEFFKGSRGKGRLPLLSPRSAQARVYTSPLIENKMSRSFRRSNPHPEMYDG